MFTASPMTESFPFGCEHLLRSLSRIKNCSQVKKLTPQMSVRLRSASHYVQRLRNSCCCCERAFRFCGFPPALPQKRTTPPRMTEDTLYFSQVRKKQRPSFCGIVLKRRRPTTYQPPSKRPKQRFPASLCSTRKPWNAASTSSAMSNTSPSSREKSQSTQRSGKEYTANTAIACK